GHAMVRLNTDAIRARVAALPRVSSAEVHRSWPSTVQNTITERVPVAFARAADGVHLIDAAAVNFAVVPTPPRDQPEVISADEPAARAAINVLGRIPQQLRAQVVTVNAHTAGDVVLNLAGGRSVKWGAKPNFQPGYDVKAKITVFAEGPRGSLTKQLVESRG